MERIGMMVVALALVVSPSLADCVEKLSEVDRKLAAVDLKDPHLMEVLKQLRDQGAAECRAGNEASAGAHFTSITMMLAAQSQLTAPRPEPEATPDQQQPDRTVEKTTAGHGRRGLLPYVVIKDPGAVDSLDWAALRKQAGTDYPSRWDDLSLVDSCLWITAGELAERLGLSARLTARRDDAQCKYRVELPSGESGVLLSVYVELHEGTEYPRKAETGFSEGVSGMQFTPFDPGTPDLKVYVHKKSEYLYAFPRNGRTYWRLGYRPGYGMEEVYRPEAGAGVDREIGPLFVRLLVEKYGKRL